MIKTLELTNFGPVEHEIIDLGLLFRVKGLNNVGKTITIYEPLEIVLLGQDLPPTYVRTGQKSLAVKITFDDGRTITRTQTPTGNQTCVCVDADGKEVINATTIRGSQELIQKFTRIKEVKLIKDEVEPLSFVPLHASSIYMIMGSRPDTIFLKLSALGGGTEVVKAKKSLASDLRVLEAERTKQKADGKKMRFKWRKLVATDIESKIRLALGQYTQLEAERVETAHKLDSIREMNRDRPELVTKIADCDLKLAALREVASDIDSREGAITDLRTKKVGLEANLRSLRKAEHIDLEAMELEEQVIAHDKALSEARLALEKLPVCPKCGQAI